MTIADKLNKTSSILFLTGNLLSKFQYIPYPLASGICRFLSLGIFLLAYGLTMTASTLEPDEIEYQDQWYDFAQIKEQFIFSSSIGLVATIVSIVALFVPAMLPLAAWLFLLGNTIWAVGEYHKLNNPPAHSTNFSYQTQNTNVAYALTSTASSLVSAIATTLILLFPAIALPITVLSVLLGLSLAVCTFNIWLNAQCRQPETLTSSYLHMNSQMKPSLAPQDSPTPDLGHYFDLQRKKVKATQSMELVNLSKNQEIREDRGLEVNSSL